MSESAHRLNAALDGRYRIVGDLGEGGMARVYLADDLRHDRRVALKVLKPELAAVIGAERFIQEIKTTANLHHPHILPLYDSGEAGGFLYYVMPFIDGETLRGRLDRETQLGVGEAVRIAGDVADALDYAHRQGVVHRDIKPENVLLHEGRPLVADFGIALAVSAAGGGRMTETGLSLGTPHYMSPEQATAEKELSGRSDVYSLGSVLYEMLTGDPPHTGSSAQQVIMKILTDPARPVSEVRRSVPPNVAAAVARSLEKLPADRFATAREFALALGDANFRHETGLAGAAAPEGARGRGWKIATAVLAVVAGGLLLRDAGAPRGGTDGLAGPPAPIRAASILLPEATPLALVGAGPLGVGFKAFDLSPDGGLMVFVGQSGDVVRLQLRDMTNGTITPVAGTEGAYAPFFSPDGEWIGYFAGASLAKVSVDGGLPLPIASVRLPYGGAWLPDGRILLAENEGSLLTAVPAAGGRPDTLRFAVRSLVFPEAIPDEAAVLLSSSENLIARVDAGSGETRILTRRGWVEEASVDAGDVDPGDLIRGTHPRALDGGRLLFTSPVGSVMQVRLPAAGVSGEPGEPAQVLEDLRVETVWGAAQWDVAGDGTMVHVPGENALLTSLVRRSSDGAVEPLAAFGRENWGRMDLSPSGRRLLVSACSVRGECGHQVLNLAEGLARSLSTGGATDEWRGWYDEDRLFAWPERQGSEPLSFVVQADNPTARDTVRGYAIQDVAGDGLVLAGAGDATLVIGPRATFPAGARRIEIDPAVGWGWVVRPGGGWVAYTAIVEEDGEWQVYLARTAPPWERFRVSPGGGEEPVWLPDGSLAYREGSRWMAVAPPSGSGPPGVPRFLFEGPYVNVLGRSHDVDPAGRHLLVEAPGELLSDRLTVVTGWTGSLPELRRP